MHWFNVRLATRRLRHDAGYTALNVGGLAIGLACCLLIAMWAHGERTHDRFHTQSERLYRLNKVHTLPTGEQDHEALSSGPMAPTLVADFPEVEAAVRILPWFADVLLQRGETALPISDVTFADANLFEVFDYQLLHGDPGTALEAPLSMVLTEQLARTFFGDADPMGQALVGQGDLTYTVTGIVEDTPAASHLQYNAFVSWASVAPGEGGLEMGWLMRWLPQSMFTYVLLQPEADVAALEAKLPGFMETHFPERAEQYQLYLQPLEDIYLNSTHILYQRSVILGNQMYVTVLSVVALLILLIACVNFMNLATARAGRRAGEVGIRKSVGAQRAQLIVQFLGEAFVLIGLSLGLALLLVEATRPVFNTLLGTSMEAFAWATPSVLAAVLGLGLVVGLAAGLYPAVVLSAFRPSRALKHDVDGGGRRFRQVLVTAQFAASIALLSGTALVVQQMRYVQSENAGYDREQIVVLPTGPTSVSDQVDAFKEEVLRHPSIVQVSASSNVPGESIGTYGIEPEGHADEEGMTAAMLMLDDAEFMETYGLTMASGRFFDGTRAADSSAVVLNEAMIRSLGWTEAIGRRFDVSGELEGGRVIGVVGDFQVTSMHQEIEPLVMVLQPRPDKVSIRVAGGAAAGALSHLRATWERFETRYPFEYTFLDDAFAELYQSDRRLMQTLSVFAALAVLIACLGLLGLAAYTAERRKKEIGVRKVLGAGVPSIVGLLARDYLKLVAVGFVVAVPLAYIAAERWLSSFVYRIDVGASSFALAGGIVLAVVGLTVGLHALRAAGADPIRALRAG
ncbi:MAG: ABC transporter permease [Bacteroidota bacterium]